MDLLQQAPIHMLTPSPRLFPFISMKVNYSSRMLPYMNYLRIHVLQVFTWQRPCRHLCSAQVYLTEHYKIVVKCLSAAVSAACVCSCLKSSPEERSLLQNGQIPKHSEMKTLICNIYMYIYIFKMFSVVYFLALQNLHNSCIFLCQSMSGSPW